jgi:SMI1-KNR4 cell-wall
VGSVPLPNVEALARLLIVDEPVGDDMPWPAIEQAWGVVFPNDYKQFLGLYGAGSFGDCLSVMAPFPQDHEAHKAGHRMVPLDREILEELCCPFPAYPEAGGVIAIGAAPNGDTLLYRTAPEPQDWRIVTWSRCRLTPEDRWTEHELGFVDCTDQARPTGQALPGCRFPESADKPENQDANRATELTRRRSAHTPYDRIAETPSALENDIQVNFWTQPSNRLNILVPQHVTAARHDRTNENGHCITVLSEPLAPDSLRRRSTDPWWQ